MNPLIRMAMLVAGLGLSISAFGQGNTAIPRFGGLPMPDRTGATQFMALQVDVLEEMDFGRIVSARQQSGTVRLDSNRSAFVTGGTEALPGSRSITRIQVKGTPNQQVSAMLPSTVTLQGSRGGQTSMSAFQVLPSIVQTLDASGVAVFSIVSTLNMPANLPDGRYTADVLVSFDYQ